MDDLLLDSSYLLPIFGVGLEYRDFELVFPKLADQYSIRYNPVSIIEAKWYVLKQIKKKKANEDLLQSYRRGLSSLERDQTLKSTPLTNEKIEELSDALLVRYSLQDYFDRLIFSTSAHFGSILLTEDNLLHELFNTIDNDLSKPKKILRWKDLLTAQNRSVR